MQNHINAKQTIDFVYFFSEHFRPNRVRSASPAADKTKEKEKSRNSARGRDTKRRGSVSSSSGRYKN